ncbi:molybdopterin molybdotransferase MoeA [Miltoncostaea marina]|uniref:molybdopterin molybdotransferase MoeA n=1 Tax=Miltoncostaea marina TaxID=2843215 RepID=UPI001C3E5CEF|nr:molybdopterin molybdotransferase MoeA [Miltoncostaea marina]
MSLRDVTFDEALELVRSHAVRTEAEAVDLDDLPGRRLAQEIRSRIDVPAFTNSAMDGFALRAADAAAGAPLPLAGESRAGAPLAGGLPPGAAVRISTGAIIPDGADAVLRREDAEDLGDRVRPRVAVEPGAHVRHRGEGGRRGDVLLQSGHRVRAHEVAAIAAVGTARALCDRRPRVVVLASGDEVIGPDRPLGPGQVYDANRPGVAAQARAAGADVLAAGLVPDHRAATVAAIAAALDAPVAPDLLVTTGGVSVGDHDHLRPAFAELGVREVFFGAQIRPGHPLWLGRRGEQVVLGLPGNPVSATVCFHAFARPLLGHDDAWDRRMPLAVTHRSKIPRTELLRCAERDGALVPMAHQGSHEVSGLAGATHLAVVPAEAEVVDAGETVRSLRLT